jgi:PAS domain S-box-containing protein
MNPNTPNPMNDIPRIRVLHLEDTPHDAELIADKLETGGLSCDIVLVSTEAQFAAALNDGTFDIILCDYNLGNYDGISALKLALKTQPLTPVLLISGKLDEEEAVKCLHLGATDYLLKQKLERLPSAVQRALTEAEELRQRKQTEEHNHELACLLDKAHDAVYVLSLDQHITYWNQGAERLYGWTADEVHGKRVVELLYLEDTPELAATSETVLTKGDWQGELHQVNKAGKEVIVMARRSLLRDEEGNPVSILNINTDITEKKRLESHLARAQRLESMTALAGGVAHDLNDALGPILVAGEMLRLRYPQDKDLVDTLALSTMHGANMVKQLMTFAVGVEGERLQVRTRHLFSQVETIIRGAFPQNIALCTRIPDDLHPVCGDATQLHRVVLNICLNARDAMPRGGTLTLEAENVQIDTEYASTVPDAKPGHYVLWSITDTGTGIAPEIMERVFEPFFSTKDSNSSGLGLSTSIGIVKSHSGFVQVYSTPGEGSTFAVYLPVVGIHDYDDSSFPASADTALRGNGEAILVVDGDVHVRQLARTALTALNFKVHTAADFAEAVLQIGDNQDELCAVITNLRIPHIESRALIQIIQRMLPEAEIIVACCNINEDELAMIQTLGINEVIDRPVTQDNLALALKLVLENSDAIFEPAPRNEAESLPCDQPWAAREFDKIPLFASH